MKAHSTAVDLCQNDVNADVLVQLRQLQANHLWLRQQLTQLQRVAFASRLNQRRILLNSSAALECKLRQLQLRHQREWGL
ncbi:uncharacterized protein LOC117574950 [Drosophila albomicans]|uniref:Uncharacterized protein LOC117574950 n=1 Tax=Drosophila albomicans TaxID=7291 RepID=A0A6P8XPC1_DROAB|nr:uncharacterized protein LOC117574950 [Drosophila albomicans]